LEWTSKPPALEEMNYSLTPDVTGDTGLQSLRLLKKIIKDAGEPVPQSGTSKSNFHGNIHGKAW